MSSPFAIRRVPQPEGVDYLFERTDDAEIPVRAEKLLLGVMGLIVLSMLGSATALLSHLLTARGVLVGFPWWAVGVVGLVVVAVLGVHRWVLGLDDEELRVAVRQHHVRIGTTRITFTEITSIQEHDAGLSICTESAEHHLPTADPQLLADLQRGAAAAQPAEPPAALRALQRQADAPPH